MNFRRWCASANGRNGIWNDVEAIRDRDAFEQSLMKGFIQESSESMARLLIHKSSKSLTQTFKFKLQEDETKRQDISEAAFNLIRSVYFPSQHQESHVMAAQSAAKAINTQEITDKARRELLLLLESVCCERDRTRTTV